jgi:hypothetical protein
MALTITRKTRTILLIILAVLVVGGGGFLIWRVTREETVAPEEGEAASCEGYKYNGSSGCIWRDLPSSTKCCHDGATMCDSISECWDAGVGGSSCQPGACNFCVNGSWQHGIPAGCYKVVDGCYMKCSKYTPVTKYTLKYIAGTGGKISGATTQTVEKGKSGSKVTAVPNSGYRFSKWSDGNTSASRTDTNVQRNITVTAQFTAQKYTVTYNGNGGTCTPTSREITHGQTSAKPSCTRTGHSLTGFTKTSGSCGSLDSTTGAVTNVTCNLTIKATWAKNTYTVTYDANGGTCEPTTRSVEYGNNSEAPTCTRSGYYVASFSRTGGSGGDLNTETGAISNVIGDQTIQVNWSKSCGDGTCADDENAQNCPADCLASCGDGYCTHDETALSCPADCEASCGDGYCTHDENAENCPQDCDENCGDGICTGDENAQNCPADCESECGDGYCTAGEDSDNCPEDCGEPVAQGDTVPETGILDTVLGRISLGLSFIFLGGLVSQYSRINYFFNSISEKREFRKEIQKEKRAKRRQEKSYQRAEKRREKLEDRFK